MYQLLFVTLFLYQVPLPLVIITSQTVIIRFLSNDGCYLKCRNFAILIKEILAFLGIKQSTSILMQTLKNVFFAKFCCKFLAFLAFCH